MFKSMKRFFDDNLDHKEGSNLSDEALKLAAAVILYEAARADFHIDPLERKKLLKLIAERFGLSSNDTVKLLELAEEKSDLSAGLHEFTTLINQHWTTEERIMLVDNMWEIVYADGHLDSNEHHLMRRVQNLLYVPHRDYIFAKLKHKTP